MKRIWPYFILQMLLATLAGCAALHGPAKDTDPTYVVLFTVATPEESELRNAIAGIPVIKLEINHPIAVTYGTQPYQLVEMRLRGDGAVERLKRSLAEAGITVTAFQMQEVSL